MSDINNSPEESLEAIHTEELLRLLITREHRSIYMDPVPDATTRDICEELIRRNKQETNRILSLKTDILNLQQVIIHEAGHDPDCPVVHAASVDCPGGYLCPGVIQRRNALAKVHILQETLNRIRRLAKHRKLQTIRSTRSTSCAISTFFQNKDYPKLLKHGGL